jgi:phospholipid/cholesterol/gamma-HCH transport system permease protein
MKTSFPVTSIIKTLQVTKGHAIVLKEKVLKETKTAKNFLSDVADFFLFFSQIIRDIYSGEFEFREFVNQCSIIAVRTLPLISVTGIIMGLVLSIQSRPVLVGFGAVSLLPAMVVISLIREMAPVITALICAGKIASGFGAELGSMKVTEQIDAMEVSATNPVKFLVVTRVLAATLMIPLLVLYADALGVLGSWAGANIKGSVTFNLFLSQAFSHIGFIDLIPAIIKSFFFGAVIGLVGCYKGFTAGRGTESVGIAANSAVVLSSLLVIIVDLIAVQITDLL